MCLLLKKRTSGWNQQVFTHHSSAFFSSVPCLFYPSQRPSGLCGCSSGFSMLPWSSPILSSDRHPPLTVLYCFFYSLPSSLTWLSCPCLPTLSFLWVQGMLAFSGHLESFLRSSLVSSLHVLFLSSVGPNQGVLKLCPNGGSGEGISQSPLKNILGARPPCEASFGAGRHLIAVLLARHILMRLCCSSSGATVCKAS